MFQQTSSPSLPLSSGGVSGTTVRSFFRLRLLISRILHKVRVELDPAFADHLCNAQYANSRAVRDPVLFSLSQVFVWHTHRQGTSCPHVNGWCSSRGTAVPSLSSLFDPPSADCFAARLSQLLMLPLIFAPDFLVSNK